MNNPKPDLSERECWLICRLIENLRERNITFQGKDGELTSEFDRLRDKCLSNASNFTEG